jgi:hypothetical protein
MKYAPGKVPARPLPAAPSRPGVKPTVTGAPDKNIPFVINNKPILGMRPTGPGIPPQAIDSKGAGLGKRMGMKKGGKVSSASKRADGCAVKGKTKGKMV